MAEVTVPNPDRALLPGMIARVELSHSVDEAIVIPQEWVVTRLDGYGVFVEEDGVARWRPVDLGTVIRHQVVVKQGLSPGDRIVISGHQNLLDGDLLSVSRSGECCTDGRVVFGGDQAAMAR